MVQIGNFFGSFLGYLLWFFYTIFKNYGVAIILFTLLLKIIMFPLSVKQQKSMAASSKLSVKQKELQKKYDKDKARYNEELQKLYQKEGVSPTGGCLPSLIPFPIMIGLYYTVINPLTNALHIAGDSVAKAVEVFQKLPAVGHLYGNSQYAEIEIIKFFTQLKPHLTMFNPDDLAKIEDFSHGFYFLGWDLLQTPQGSAFESMLWLIPVLCFLSSVLTQYFTTKFTSNPAQQQQGCMKWIMYLFPLITVYISYTLPAAVGFYWIISSLISFLQTVVMNIFFSPAHLVAKSEAQRVALLETEEVKVRELSLADQQAIAIQLENRGNQSKQNKALNAGQKDKGKNKGDSNQYLGSKK